MAISRPWQASLVGGSLASIAVRFLEETFQQPGLIEEAGLTSLHCPVCPAEVDDFVHVPSFCWGLLAGIFLGPLIDLVYYLRVSWSDFVRSRVLRVRTAGQGQLYRILS